jgi:hypothetical protein
MLHVQQQQQRAGWQALPHHVASRVSQQQPRQKMCLHLLRLVMPALAAAEQLQQRPRQPRVPQLVLKQGWLLLAWVAAPQHMLSPARRLVAGHC